MISPRKSVCLALAIALMSLGLSDRARAVTITGTIDFEGMFALNGGVGTATAFTSISGVTVDGGTGDYMGVPIGTPVTYPAAGFAFNPPNPNPVAPLWTFTLAGPTVYSFDLYSVSVLAQNPFILALGGTGVAKITGFEDTNGTWNFVYNGFGATLFEFHSTSVAAGVASPVPPVSVPDGGATVALLGFSLLGVETLRRKFKRAA